jgi:hypothetical protein
MGRDMDFGSRSTSSDNAGRRSARRPNDLVILALLAALSVAPYVLRLGFYSDDWAVLAMLVNSQDQSLSGLLATQYANNDSFRMRPTQMVYYAALFTAFGIRPLGYHVVNAAVLASVVLLLYLVLRETGMSLTVARAVSAVYLVLPNYSTDRFWFAAFAYALAAALFLLSTYALLKASRDEAFNFWYAVALFALTASVLGMELFLPLSLAVPVALALRNRKRGRLKTLLLLGGPIVIIAAAIWYKAESAVGAAWRPDSPDFSSLVRLVVGSVAVNFGTFGIALPHTVAWSVRQLMPAAMVLPVILGAIVFWWLLREGPPPHSRRSWIEIVMAGGLVFCFGIAIFVVAPSRVSFWSTGVSNRAWIAASLGTAAMLVGAAGWLTSGLPPALHRRLFSALIAALCASCFVIAVCLSEYWIAAWPTQLEILDKMQRALPGPQPGTTLILYGPCAYVGPAIVFEAPWDFAGARKVVYRDPTLGGDVLNDSRPGRFGITDEGLWTRFYGESQFYRFGPDLFLFDYRAGKIRPLSDRVSAVAGLSEPTGCPPGIEGRGTVSLPLDTWYSAMSADISRLWR